MTARLLLLATVALGWYDVGIIWLVQVSYRLWAFVGPAVAIVTAFAIVEFYAAVKALTAESGTQ